MAILINKNTKILIQGITGNEGRKATKQMLEFGSKILCGVTPNKAGENVEGVPVYSTISDSLKDFPDINVSVIYVPPRFAKSAIKEAIENKIELIICISENVPLHDVLEMIELSKKNNVRLLGPSSIGVISPGKSKVGSIGGSSNSQYIEGNVGIISKSGGLCSETAELLTKENIGQSSVIGIGGDIVSGSDYVDLLREFEKDEETKAVIILGEIGGEYEQKVADIVEKKEFTKPLVAFISGSFATSLPNISLGHAGAIIEGDNTTQEAKIKRLEEAGIEVAKFHHEILPLIKQKL